MIELYLCFHCHRSLGSAKFIAKVLLDGSAALAHIHSCHLVHGDFYAHNILVDKTVIDFETQPSLLTDFGAASQTSNVNGEQYFIELELTKLEKIEVRAFGCLMDDLLQQVNINHDSY